MAFGIVCYAYLLKINKKAYLVTLAKNTLLGYDSLLFLTKLKIMKQAIALEILKQGHHVFLTGQAGAGKTYVLNQYIDYLRQHGVPVAVTASTGIAATHMNGMTIHSWSGIGIKDSFESDDFKRLKAREGLIDRLKSAKVLIIDEVSMLHARQLDLVNEVLQHFRENDDAFGGLQVVLSGDFFQLPPIGQKNETTKDKFAFMSKVWIALANSQIDHSPAIKVCYLSEQHRQNQAIQVAATTLDLNAILNQIRTQTVSQQAINTLIATKDNDVNLNRTRLYTHNINVDKINQDELNALEGQSHEFDALTFGDDNLIEVLKKNVKAPEQLILKKGAKVMFVKNNPNDDVYNGTMGEVIDFQKDASNGYLPVVKLNTGRTLTVAFDVWSFDDDDGEPLASFSQLPLCLAWAITVHKSQGMTLDAAEIDLSKTFEVGQGYVALSRVRSLDGLKLLGLNQKSLLLDDFAQVANRRFLQLSAECEHWFDGLSDDYINTAKERFLSQNTILPAIKKSQHKKSPEKPDTPASMDLTMALLQEGKDIKQVAESRVLAKSTILGHIDSLVKSGKMDITTITHLAPEPDMLLKVAKAYHKLDDLGEFEGGLKLRPIYDELRETVPYDDIRLAILFIHYGDFS